MSGLGQDGKWNNWMQGFLTNLRQTICEFPKDAFTNNQRKQGAVILHLICVMYMFYALVIVCDDYFVPSLEKISEWLNLDEDVAGATFMAAGSSAPELFTSVIGVFITKGDVGVGTIVGSAVFNVLCIIGVCGLFAEQDVLPLSYYSAVKFIFFRWESLFLVIMYADGDVHRSESTLMVDEIFSSTSRKLDFSEAGLRIMITRHFEPRTRLRMASRMLINEVSMPMGCKPPPLLFSAAYPIPICGMPIVADRFVITVIELNDLFPLFFFFSMFLWCNFTFVVLHFSNPFPSVSELSEGLLPRIQWIISWPLTAMLAYTVPDSTAPRWEKFFLLSFLLSTLWIALFSYLMVWMVTVIGYTFGIPDVIMGITFLAAGTSVPDCMASLIVAKQGMGDMAVSNSNGSNIFDILIGLGLPWVVQTLLVDFGSTVKLNSRGLIYSVILLLASVSLAVLGIHLNKWRLNKKLGIGCIILYVIFLSFSILIEYNVFTFVNLPMCKDG
uniref:Solute carrier family 24 member 4b n=1 Tax=Eptatretus burgeri TaxID=7764 RepID=A0A8C4WVJ4_EPTBU